MEHQPPQPKGAGAPSASRSRHRQDARLLQLSQRARDRGRARRAAAPRIWKRADNHGARELAARIGSLPLLDHGRLRIGRRLACPLGRAVGVAALLASRCARCLCCCPDEDRRGSGCPRAACRCVCCTGGEVILISPMVMVRLRVFGVARIGQDELLNSSMSAQRVSASVMSAPFGADMYTRTDWIDDGGSER